MTAKVDGVMYLKKGTHLNTKSRGGPVTVVKSTNSPVLDSGETSIKLIQGIRVQISKVPCYILA